MWFECPYLGRSVELTDERAAHVEAGHPPIVSDHIDLLRQTLLDPDFVGERAGREEFGFCRYWPHLLGGKTLVVVVLGAPDQMASDVRYWISTAYAARSTRTWSPTWTRS